MYVWCEVDTDDVLDDGVWTTFMEPDGTSNQSWSIETYLDVMTI